MNSLYGQTIREEIDEEFIISLQKWLIKNNDD